jgi:hypothetical protein
MKHVAWTFASLSLVVGLFACEAKESKVISATGEAAEVEGAASAEDQSLVEPAKTYTQVTIVNDFETVRCERFFECFPTALVVEVQKAETVEGCVDNRIADVYQRRNGEGKPMFCNTGETFHTKQAALCLDWLKTAHCGDFVQSFMAAENPFAICQFVCTTED